MGCRRKRLEKEKLLGGDCSNLEEDGGPDRTLCLEQGDVDTLENHSCLGEGQAEM